MFPEAKYALRVPPRGNKVDGLPRRATCGTRVPRRSRLPLLRRVEAPTKRCGVVLRAEAAAAFPPRIFGEGSLGTFVFWLCAFDVRVLDKVNN